MMSSKKNDVEEILDNCLERVLRGQDTIESILKDYPQLVDDLHPRLEAAVWLTAQKSNTQPRAEFVNASSQRLMARIKQENQLKKQTQQPKVLGWQNLFKSKRFAFQFAMVVILVFSTLFFSSTMASAAQSALPGDTLYPLKTSIETAQLAVAFTPVQKAAIHIKIAEHRVVEMQTLTALGKFDDIETTINNLDENISQAVQVLDVESKKDPAKTLKLAMKVQKSLSKQEQTLNYLKGKVPQKNQEKFQHTVEMSNQGMDMAIQVIQASGDPYHVLDGILTETALAGATNTPLVGNNLSAQPTPTPASIFGDAEAEESDSADNITNTPKPTNINKPTQKPTKVPKPTKTPKPDKPTKTPKK